MLKVIFFTAKRLLCRNSSKKGIYHYDHAYPTKKAMVDYYVGHGMIVAYV